MGSAHQFSSEILVGRAHPTIVDPDISLRLTHHLAPPSLLAWNSQAMRVHRFGVHPYIKRMVLVGLAWAGIVSNPPARADERGTAPAEAPRAVAVLEKAWPDHPEWVAMLADILQGSQLGPERRLVPEGRRPDPVRLGATRKRRQGRRRPVSRKSLPEPTPTSPGSTATATVC